MALLRQDWLIIAGFGELRRAQCVVYKHTAGLLFTYSGGVSIMGNFQSGFGKSLNRMNYSACVSAMLRDRPG